MLNYCRYVSFVSSFIQTTISNLPHVYHISPPTYVPTFKIHRRSWELMPFFIWWCLVSCVCVMFSAIWWCLPHKIWIAIFTNCKQGLFIHNLSISMCMDPNLNNTCFSVVLVYIWFFSFMWCCYNFEYEYAEKMKSTGKIEEEVGVFFFYGKFLINVLKWFWRCFNFTNICFHFMKIMFARKLHASYFEHAFASNTEHFPYDKMPTFSPNQRLTHYNSPKFQFILLINFITY